MALVVQRCRRCAAAARHLRAFAYTTGAARDSAVRADAIGIDVRTHRWLAFIVAGAAAGLAGGSSPSPRAPSIRR